MPKNINLIVPDSWLEILKKEALDKECSVNNLICEVLYDKYNFAEMKKTRGRPFAK